MMATLRMRGLVTRSTVAGALMKTPRMLGVWTVLPIGARERELGVDRVLADVRSCS